MTCSLLQKKRKYWLKKGMVLLVWSPNVILLTAMEMSMDGNSMKDMQCLQEEMHANQFWPLFFCGSCVGAPLACNLTGQRYMLTYFSIFFFFTFSCFTRLCFYSFFLWSIFYCIVLSNYHCNVRNALYYFIWYSKL